MNDWNISYFEYKQKKNGDSQCPQCICHICAWYSDQKETMDIVGPIRTEVRKYCNYKVGEKEKTTKHSKVKLSN